MLSKFHAGRVVLSLVREHFEKRVRSPHWPAARRAYLKENGACAACGSKMFLQVHHKVPFCDRPELELDPSNFITLCMGKFECHLHLGHGGDYHYFNPQVVRDCRVIALYPDRRRDIELTARMYRRNKP